MSENVFEVRVVPMVTAPFHAYITEEEARKAAKFFDRKIPQFREHFQLRNSPQIYVRLESGAELIMKKHWLCVEGSYLGVNIRSGSVHIFGPTTDVVVITPCIKETNDDSKD